jgi:hypothetical protein
MYSAQTSKRGVDLLDDRLAKDPNGELLISLITHLEQSQAEIVAALDQPRPAEEQRLLQQLQQAINLSDSMLRDVWQQIHERAAPC